MTLYGFSLYRGGFSAPIRDLWPPDRGDQQFKIVIFTDGLHSEIGVWPENDAEGQRSQSLESWSYGERGYYMEGKTGVIGMLRATLIPTAGVVRVHRAGWRFTGTQNLPDKTWELYVSREGYDRLLAHVRAQCESTNVIFATGRSEWYDAKHSYHTFHNCHHWTARALRAAGLPVWSSHALFRWSLEKQLDRAVKMQRNNDA